MSLRGTRDEHVRLLMQLAVNLDAGLTAGILEFNPRIHTVGVETVELRVARERLVALFACSGHEVRAVWFERSHEGLVKALLERVRKKYE